MLPVLLIPILPFLAFLVIALGGRWIRGRSHLLSVPALAASFLLTIWAFARVRAGGPIALSLYSLFQSGSLTVRFGFYLDQVTVLLLLLVTGVSALVHIFSIRYMQGDPRYARFFAVITLFTFCMLMLVMSSHLLMLYFFWELMGLCSYLLINHCAERPPAGRAATKAFLVNAAADIGLALGILLTGLTVGTLEIPELFVRLRGTAGESVNLLGWIGLEGSVQTATLISILFLIGACGKSAQIPFHVWLPYAMEAPTPVSALIHAATMVNAGVYLMIRMSPLFILSPAAMGLLAVVGGTTAAFAALVALTQSDIKRILAYSTMSQLGFMMLACGLGAYVAAAFHLLAHGILKAFLFLSAGSALRSIHPSSPRPAVEARRPDGSWVRLASALLMSWIPAAALLLGGYDLLWKTSPNGTVSILFWVMVLSLSFLTARSLRRWTSRDGAGILEPGPGGGRTAVRPPVLDVLTGPLLIGSVTVAVGIPLSYVWSGFSSFLSPVWAPTVGGDPVKLSGSGSMIVWFLPAAAALVGWATLPMAARLSIRSKAFYVFILNRGYFDEIYEALLIRPTIRMAEWLWRAVDLRGIDYWIVESGTQTIRIARWLWRTVDVRGIDYWIVGSGRRSLTAAHWLWRTVDLRGIERMIGGIARQNEAYGEVLHEVEPRLLQQQIFVMILCLILAMGMTVWLLL